MSTSPANHSAESRGSRRLLWLLVFVLLFIGALNIFVSIILPGAVQRWLHERGLEAQIEHMEVSLPRLRAHLRGVQVRNEFERGFNVSEATLGLSWLQLLRGKIHVKMVDLEGAYMDLESAPGEYGRVWEIGGWGLKEGGEKKPRRWRVDLSSTTLRDTVVCYQHKPQWKSPTCADIGYLELEDLFVAGHREIAGEPLQFSIGADNMALENLLAWDEHPQEDSGSGPGGRTQEPGEGDMRKSARENPIAAVVRLKTRNIRFERPGNLLTLTQASTRKFAVCPPQRLAEAIPGLRRVTGHCATTRRLQVRGPASFSFGKQSEIAWHRINGQELRLRYQNRRHPNWHTETIAINDFGFVRGTKSMTWQSAGASGFSWCPNRLRTGPSRTGRHHYCIRAGSLRLPQPTTFEWQQGFRVDLAEGVLTQGTVIDLDAKTPPENPLNTNTLRLGALQYRNDQRRVQLQDLSLDGATGCVPGDLWGRGDQCLLLTQLQIPQDFSLQFPRKAPKKTPRGILPAQFWALDSGPLTLDKLQLNPGQVDAEQQLILAGLDWSRVELAPQKKQYLVEDVNLEKIEGCAPDGLLPQRLSPLCSRVDQLHGNGDFILALAPSPYLVLGELTLASLLLSDHLDTDPAAQTGLVLRELATGTGFFRLRSQRLKPGEYFASEDAHGWFSDESEAGADEDDDTGVEKGRLPAELLAEDADPDGSAPGHTGEAIGSEIVARETEVELASLSLTELEGCLPLSWQALAGGGNPEQRAECFSVHNLRQQAPLNLVLARKRNTSANGGSRLRMMFSAADLSVETADVTSAAEHSLLSVSQLRLPKADFRLQSHPGRLQLDVPGAALDTAAFCFGKARCVDLQTLRTGDHFTLDYGRDRFAADLNNLTLDQFTLSGSERDTTLAVEKLQGLSLQANLPRKAGARADWKIEQLQAQVVELCWPQRDKSDRMLPRCVRGKKLSSGNGGLAVADLALHQHLSDPPQLHLGALQIEKLGLVQAAPPSQPVQLNLHNVRLQSVSGCGLNDWLAAAQVRGESRARWRGCLSSGSLHLSGDNLVSLGGGEQKTGESNFSRLALGPLQLSDVKLAPATGAAPSLQLAQLQWQSMQWPGGTRVRVEDLDARDFSGCLPGRPQAPASNEAPPCISFGKLLVSGKQKLALGEELRTTGPITLADFEYRRGEQKRLGFTNLAVNGLVFSPTALALQRGELSGLSGCLSPVQLGEKPLSPCYEVGRITVVSEHKVLLSDLRSGNAQRQFREITVDGLRVTQRDFPAGLPSELLHIATLRADLLGFGQRELEGKNLQLENVSSCVPDGYINHVRHCFNLKSVLTSGTFSFEQRRLELTLAQLGQLLVLDIDGGQVLESEFIEMRELTVAREVIRLMFLDVADSRLFRRDERAQEYVNHQWNTEIESLQVNQFEYFPPEKILQVDTVDLIHPRSILARDRDGKLGAWERFRSEIPEVENYRYRRGDIARTANRFRYRVRQVYVDRGDFLWLDNSQDYMARLPIRRINALVRGLSNYQEDPPALVLVNGSPGGYSDMHFAGNINLLENNHWDAGLLGYVEAANLIPATPYMAGLLGFKILQGQLDADVNIKVDDNQVDALAHMELEKIKVRHVRDSDYLEGKKSLIPLKIALALLKDGDGDVHFDMPVTGELTDPKFSFSFIFSDLLQRAILEALFAYFTPVGVYSLAKLAWARFRAVSFSDLEFAPGSDTLSETAKVQLNGMLAKMRDNPKARPGICGVATARDLENMFPLEVGAVRGAGEARDELYKEPPRGIREELLRLSNRRSRHVQKFLVDAGLDQEDFIQCAPDYIGTDSDAPRVEFSN
ncbi:DUF748 domain-containing protein [Microbulbifer hydrolyticus]|uniref:DUF748 domain-containing protein n=1 Tax=Microbulbifer hydrolyticus TaxID=48074 RepID=A0A6P1TEB3_9GAMM|nr:DUF748 domain-containing protein [Microbulbifer hydrolyticus]MBB5212563.1 hypothetical protein [Microbulbifer hydrolyticus]QHQ40181.1 DUF748 domain-containing protein [Microbulbifer hydrolyticus]